MSKLTAASTYKLASGFQIPVIGFGVYLTPQDVAQNVIYKALEIGYRHFDTAQYYNNEQEVVDGISSYLKDHPNLKRSDIFYTTKVDTPNQGYEKTKISLEQSLLKAKALKYIDLVLVHAPLTNKEKRLGTYKALQEYVETGKIRSIGVSNYGISHIEELYNWEGFKIPISANQIELNPWLTRKELVEYCRSKNIAVEAFSPLTRGKRIDDPELTALAKKYNKTPAQILLRWSLDSGFITLPKTVTEKRMVENLDIFDFELEKEDFKSLTHDDQYWISAPHWDPVTYEG
ncbi:hypothetical protein PACTADRAFT_49326 [Pachysolen tannophilus NRRL Y-2460]|uniref:NADP-dependent oxidoreductase domain-containing protein n=1 Tax=Pachysolen tannophilus NRRL Y-2460 TaxID=669874 RepID=A0A1E4TVW9_PACTA|nr:hypothetical protein PACTADRAFT_49326 [Pachysolen tannophilus NRRL Y-2460]